MKDTTNPQQIPDSNVHINFSVLQMEYTLILVDEGGDQVSTTYVRKVKHLSNLSSACPGRILGGIIDQNPEVPQSIHLHVVIFRYFFMNLQ